MRKKGAADFFEGIDFLMDDVGRSWQGAAICAAIVFLMAFFTACENALIEMNDAKAKKLCEKHKRGKTLASLLEKPNRLVRSNLIFRSFMIIALSAAATVYFYAPIKNKLIKALTLAFDNSQNVAYAAGGLSFLLIICLLSLVISVFGIILPKRLCAGGKISDRFVLNTCLIYKVFLSIFFPLEAAASGITSLLLKVFGVRDDSAKEAVTEEEILMMVDAVNETGEIEESQAEMISNIFRFDDLEVHEIMTHRMDVTAIEQDKTIGEGARLVIEEGFSRIPVYEKNIDSICGVIFAKDLLKAVFTEHLENEPVRGIMREIKYIPESNSCGELLEYFTSQRNQIAVVVDEYGGTAGIVTMEDLLESIVGNIQDEYDNEVEEIQEITPNTFDILGKADPKEAFEKLGVQLPESAEHETMSSFFIELLGHFPSENENASVQYQNVVFTIIKVSDKRIEKLRAVIKHEADESAPRE